MSQHATHEVHQNSRAAWAILDAKSRTERIFAVYRDSQQPLTDRDVLGRLGLFDMNHVRPRITELVDKGKLAEVGKMRDKTTGMTVRCCTNVTMSI